MTHVDRGLAGTGRDDTFNQIYRDGRFGVMPAENTPLLVELVAPGKSASRSCRRRSPNAAVRDGTVDAVALA